MSRITRDEYYLNIAAAVAKGSTCIRRQYGAVLVKNNEIIATGYNGSPRGEVNCCDTGECQRNKDGSKHNDNNYSNCPAVHAEMNAIISASRKDMLDSTLYLACIENGNLITNYEPCAICARMIKNSGIAKVVTYKS